MCAEIVKNSKLGYKESFGTKAPLWQEGGIPDLMRLLLSSRSSRTSLRHTLRQRGRTKLISIGAPAPNNG